MNKKTLLLIGLLPLTVAQVNAQSLNIGPQIGYYKAQDADNGSVMGGIAARLKFLPLLGTEASVNYRQEKFGHGAVTVSDWPIMVTGLIYPLPIVYGAIGAGWYNVTFDYKDPTVTDVTTQKFGWHFGGGAELPVGPKIKLTGDIRYVFLNYDFKTVPGVSGPKSDFFVITVGFLFGV
ncbi:MAG: outer membrane beta-barrel protein [Chitinivibrionales bacterium]|nr:outer membrane beta-barrel protein [Chitinivibrionales bacterium]